MSGSSQEFIGTTVIVGKICEKPGECRNTQILGLASVANCDSVTPAPMAAVLETIEVSMQIVKKLIGRSLTTTGNHLEQVVLTPR